MMADSTACPRVIPASPDRSDRRWPGLAGLLLGGLLVLLPAAVVRGQEGVAPLDCWWRTSVSAITIGQPFTLVLTCAAIETESIAAVVDRARLDPRAIELAPFEILGGSVAADVQSGDRTFFQMQYTLRFINAAFFNQDIALPNLAISYRIQTRGGAQAAATEGIERRFAMPHQTIRVTSLVPADAADIRDAGSLTFADLEVMASRGRLMTTGGLLLVGLSAAIALVGVGRTLTARRPGSRAMTHGLGDTRVLRAASRALAAVRRRRDGSGSYAADDIAEALAATRLVADCALDRTPSQHIAAANQPLLSGALALPLGWRGGRRAIVSGSATANTVAAARASLGDTPQLTALQTALTVLTGAQYDDRSAERPDDEASLDVAVDGVLGDVQRIARRLAIERAPGIRLLTRRAWRTPAGEPAR